MPRPSPTLNPASRRFHASAWAVAGVVMTSYLARALFLPNSSANRFASDACFAAAGIAACFFAIRAARRTDGAYRKAWYLIGILLPVVNLSSVIAMPADLARASSAAWNSPSAPGFGDIAMLVCVPVGFGGAMMLGPSRDHLSRIRASLDGLLVAGSGLFVAWVLGLGAIFYAGSDGMVSRLIRIDAPLVDLTFAVLLVFIVSAAPRGTRLSFGLLTAALAGALVGDTGQSYLSMTGGYYHGAVTDTAALGAIVLVALSATHARVPADNQKLVMISPLHSLFPYLAVLGVIGTGGYTFLTAGHLDTLLTCVGILLGLVILLRQLVELRENSALTRALRARTEDVEASEARFRGLVQNSMDATLVLDTGGAIVFAAPAAERIFGWRPDELVGTKLIRVVHPDDVGGIALGLDQVAVAGGRGAAMEFRVRHRDARWVNVESIPTNLIGIRGVDGIVLNTWDVTERRAMEDRLRHLAFHDPLTELANRALFRDRLDHALKARNTSRDITVLYLDLDDFKEVNDTFGHSSGDDLLRAVAQRIGSCLRAGDTAARMGGDEFAIVLEDADVGTARHVAQRILRSLQKHFDVSDHAVSVKASIGLASGHPGQEADVLLHRADTALHQAKQAGKGSVVTYEATMEFVVDTRVPNPRRSEQSVRARRQ